MSDEPAAEERGAPNPGLTRGELISAASAVLLVVLMFAVAWYGVDRIPGAAATSSPAATSESAWNAMSVIRWLLLATILVALGTVAIHAGRPTRVAVARARLALLVLSTLSAAALIWRVLLELPSPDRVADQKLGAVLGMFAALGIAFGSYEAVREQRARLAGIAPSSNARGVASGRPGR